jgi:hypothetical protein
LFYRFFDDGLARSRLAHEQAQTTLLRVHLEDGHYGWLQGARRG